MIEERRGGKKRKGALYRGDRKARAGSLQVKKRAD